MTSVAIWPARNSPGLYSKIIRGKLIPPFSKVLLPQGSPSFLLRLKCLTSLGPGHRNIMSTDIQHSQRETKGRRCRVLTGLSNPYSQWSPLSRKIPLASRYQQQDEAGVPGVVVVVVGVAHRCWVSAQSQTLLSAQFTHFRGLLNYPKTNSLLSAKTISMASKYIVRSRNI